ncbi:hypothetical protein [Aureimonas leprariae]|uniref:hypothetical protein n=1 Tax=Plantimonas leprariae TaxID=2615207 RepID=UPI0013869A95|nr:hypothetical protein [Aureimonas leprariae]
MTNSTFDSNLWLIGLEAPVLDMSGGDAAQALLDRLKSQNTALDRLRFELAVEDRFQLDDARIVESF